MLVPRVVEIQAGVEPEEADKMKDFLQDIHLTLVFLWAASRSLITEIQMEHPPKADNVDEVCNMIIQ
jgi:hypothetical protein